MISITSFGLILLAFLPIVAIWTLIHKGGDPETVARRSLLFLCWTALALLAAILLAAVLAPFGSYGYAGLLAPLAVGLLTLAFLHLRNYATLRSHDRVLLLLGLLLLLALAVRPFWATFVEGDFSRLASVALILAIFAVALLLALAWAVGRRRPLALGLLAFLCLALFNGLGMAELPVPAAPLIWGTFVSAASIVSYFGLPALVVSSIAILLASGLQLLPSVGTSGSRSSRASLGRLALAAVILAAFLYTFAWTWLWDGTDDGLRGLVLIMVSVATAMAAAMVLVLTTSGWRRWLGLAFPLLLGGVLALAASNVWRGRDQPIHRVTEARAARIRDAIETFQARTGNYPATLSELVPAELWWISPPVILPGESWCYEAGRGYYRLAALYREHWSAPSMTVRVYASAGNPPATSWVCDQRLAQRTEQLQTLAAASRPTRVPLPASAVPVGRTVVEPTLRAPSLSVGSWSPDGAYLIFGLTAFANAQTEIELHFLSAASGEICRASQAEWIADERSDGLRQQYAWLPDGRLLYVSQAGEMVAMTPCAVDVETLSGRYPVTFSGAVSFDSSRWVLLKSVDGYWLLDGASLEARPVPGITLDPDLPTQWAAYAWSPGSKRLAISQMDGQGTPGATLFIVDVNTAALERSVRLEDASEENMPFVEWLSRDVLLLQSGLTLVDLRGDPPRMTDFIEDLLLLDVDYPTDFSSMDAVPDPTGDGYTIGVRLNHPRNQAIYLYAAETGQVEVFEYDRDMLIFFPGGEWMALPKWEDEPSYRDEYELLWADRPGVAERLVVEGHTPREQPQLFPRYLPASSQLVFSSSQGISLISLPSGKTVAFWELAGGGGYGSRIVPTPGGEALVVVAGGDGLYYIPLPADSQPVGQ